MPAKAGVETLPLVAIVGRPNVGKSTLFNRLTKSRRSIVGDEPGITRDRIYGEYEWLGRHFRLVDTGGIVPDDPELIPMEIYAQAKVALQEADALVLVVDARTELASPDYDLVKMLIRGGKPVFLAVNKVEGEAMVAAAENFRQLGLRNVFPISSEHGLGIGDMLEAIAEALPLPAGAEGAADGGVLDGSAAEAEEREPEAEDEAEDVSVMLDEKFMKQVDILAAKRGLQAADDYLAQWKWTEEAEREGSAREVAEALKAELEAKGW